MTIIQTKLPATFIRDRLDRDCDCGNVRFKGRVAIVECSSEVLADIKSDAEYQGWWTDSDDASLKRSARRAFETLNKNHIAKVKATDYDIPLALGTTWLI